MVIDLEKALSLYQQAAEQGDFVGEQRLGCCYEEGIGIARSPELAFYYYKLAADQGAYYGCFKLGWCYENGIGVLKNEKTAFHYVQEAAQSRYRKGRPKF